MSSKPFVLSVKALVSDEHGRILLIRRSAESKHNALKWDLPGGKIDPGESIDAALRREVREETGLTIGGLAVAAASQSEMHDRIVAYLIFEATTDSDPVHLSSEHDRFEWRNRSDLSTVDTCDAFAGILQQYR